LEASSVEQNHALALQLLYAVDELQLSLELALHLLPYPAEQPYPLLYREPRQDFSS
jgi:hypothetical protein